MLLGRICCRQAKIVTSRIAAKQLRAQVRGFAISAAKIPKNPETEYEMKTTSEIKQGYVLPDDQPLEDDPEEPIPEKGQAFIQKKTTIKEKIMVFITHMAECFKDIGKDAWYLTKTVARNGIDAEKNSLFELKERRRIAYDLIKFFPYAALILIPGGEIFFPVYFLLFPNSTPTAFMNTSTIGDRIKDLTKAQEEGYNLFMPTLPSFARLLGIQPDVLYVTLSHLEVYEGKKKDSEFYKVTDIEAKIIEFVNRPNLEDYKEDFDLSKLSADELEQLNKIFFRVYVPGYTWVNVLYGLFVKAPLFVAKFIAKKMESENYSKYIDNPFYRFKFTLNKGPASFLKKRLLLGQLRYHIWQLRRQDRSLAKDVDELAKLSQLQLYEYARQRGMNLEVYDEIHNYVQKYWLPLSTRKDIPSDLLVWIAVLRYKYADILI